MVSANSQYMKIHSNVHRMDTPKGSAVILHLLFVSSSTTSGVAVFGSIVAPLSNTKSNGLNLSFNTSNSVLFPFFLTAKHGVPKSTLYSCSFRAGGAEETSAETDDGGGVEAIGVVDTAEVELRRRTLESRFRASIFFFFFLLCRQSPSNPTRWENSGGFVLFCFVLI